MALTLACITPFAAMAVLASRTLPWRNAILVLLGAVIANQAAGFGLLHYPETLSTFLWGPVFFIATLAAFWASRIARTSFALVAAFAANQMVLAAYTFVTERSLGTFSPPIVAQVAFANLLGFALLGLTYLGIVVMERATEARTARSTR